jgi:hypothetical protein
MKIAFCFLIYDSINHEDLWNDFFHAADKESYSIYIHSKLNRPLKYLDDYKISKHIKTKWGDITIVKAQCLLLEEALKDQDNQIFIFISGSCIPVKSFQYIVEHLNFSYSYFNMSPDKECFPRCKKTLSYLNENVIKKAHMMSIINRKHTRLIVENKVMMMNWFNYRGTVPDEHCFITLIHYFGLQNELITTENTSYSGSTTFAAWPEMTDLINFSNSVKIKLTPYTYQVICKEEMDYLLENQNFFARKFLPNCTVDGHDLRSYVMGKIN